MQVMGMTAGEAVMFGQYCHAARKRREASVDQARRDKWDYNERRGACTMKNEQVAQSLQDMAALRLHSLIATLGAFWRAGIRWNRMGQLTTPWRPCGGIWGRAEAQRLIQDIRRDLPDVVERAGWDARRALNELHLDPVPGYEKEL